MNIAELDRLIALAENKELDSLVRASYYMDLGFSYGDDVELSRRAFKEAHKLIRNKYYLEGFKDGSNTT